MKWIEMANRIVRLTGQASAWILLALMVAIVLQVSLNAAHRHISWMEEVQWYLYGSSSMLAVAYTMTRRGHIRVDLLHGRLPRWAKQCVETAWVVLMLVPLYVVVLIHGWDFTQESFAIREGSPDPGGLPGRWVVKAFIPISSVRLLAAAAARVALVWARPEILDQEGPVYGD
ncbi:MAG: TRAP transporter small permease subunit [Planctomycetota bacterium]